MIYNFFMKSFFNHSRPLMGVVNEMVQARNQNLLGAGGWGEANPKVGGQSTPPPRRLGVHTPESQTGDC